MFETYNDPRTRFDLDDTSIYRGLAFTEIDYSAKIIKRTFAENGSNKWDRPHNFSLESLQFYYEKERDMLQYLNGVGYENAPELIEFDDSSRTVVTRYYGETLRVKARLMLSTTAAVSSNPLINFPEVRDKIIDAFRKQKELGIIKYNFHPVNLVICEDTGKLISFDWKASETPGTPLDQAQSFLDTNPNINRPIAPAAMEFLAAHADLIKNVGDLERLTIRSHWTEFDPALADELIAFIK